MRISWGEERGTLTAVVAVVAVSLVMVAGLAYDGGQIVAAQVKARDVAAAAARAGAQEVDLTVLRATGDAVLDADRAAAAAQAFLARAGHAGTVNVDADAVTVAVTIRTPMRILPLPDRHVTATDTARAVTGPEGQGTDDA